MLFSNIHFRYICFRYIFPSELNKYGDDTKNNGGELNWIMR